MSRNRPVEVKLGSVRFVVYRAANFRWGIVRNVYPEVITDSGVGKTIGWALHVGYWVLSFVFRSA